MALARRVWLKWVRGAAFLVHPRATNKIKYTWLKMQELFTDGRKSGLPAIDIADQNKTDCGACIRLYVLVLGCKL